MKRSDILKNLPVRKNDFVVEIGAGHIPYRHTKLILDKYPFENKERWGDINNVAPVIKADAEEIPLMDDACDLLFVSHVLEHIEHPERFIHEAKRCSRYIYLEFPSLKRELMYAWSYHRWVIELNEKELTFYRNDIPQFFDDFFHKNYDFIFHIWGEHRFEELNNYVCTETKDLKINFSDKTALGYAMDKSLRGDDKINSAVQERKKYSCRDMLDIILHVITPQKLINIRRNILKKLNKTVNLRLTDEILGKLICQECKEKDLHVSSGEIVCKICNAKYTERDGVFDFDSH